LVKLRHLAKSRKVVLQKLAFPHAVEGVFFVYEISALLIHRQLLNKPLAQIYCPFYIYNLLCRIEKLINSLDLRDLS